MKQTHIDYTDQSDIEKISELMSLKNKLDEKVRINLYMPKVIIELIDFLSGNTSRGKFVTALVLENIQKKNKLPHRVSQKWIKAVEKDMKEASGFNQRGINLSQFVIKDRLNH